MPMFADVETVLFDLDGTLIDSAPDLGAAVDRMRVQRGLPSLPLERYRHMAGAGARGMLSIAFDITPEHDQFAVLKDEFFHNYEACMTERTHAFDGVQALIEALQRRGTRWGVVTNKSSRFTAPLTRAMPLFSGVAVVISGDTTAHAKPHPEPLFEAARRIGVAPARCLYVGDDVRDIEAGLAAGMRTVAARYGYLGPEADISRWGAHASIGQPLGLLDLLG